MGSHDDHADETLMRLFRRNLDNDVFRTLADRHYEHALRFASARLSDKAMAYDAVQEAFVRVVRHRRRYNPAKPFVPWFFAILRNVCSDLVRKELRHIDLLRRFADMPQAAAEPHSAKERASEILRGLTEDDMRLLRLRYFSGMTTMEIADTLGCSVEAAKKRMQRLIKRVRKRASIDSNGRDLNLASRKSGANARRGG